MGIKRDIYLDKLISKKFNGLIKVVTGICRCGKSYLLFNLFKDHLLAEGVKKGVKIAKVLGYIPKIGIIKTEFEKIFTCWGVYTYTKLLSEQIFVPLDIYDDKTITYAPF